MSRMTRRQVLQAMGGAAALASGPATALAAKRPGGGGGGARPHVVVVGGGFGGATAAKYLRHWSSGNVDVTLVDANPSHVSCILSNLVLNDQVTLDSLTFGFDRLSSRFGVTIRQGEVSAIDAAARSVQLADGSSLTYDRLVLSPGIQFDAIPGLDPQRVPHAWKAGDQTTLLRQQLMAMPSGGTYVLSIPKAPYRCPPGPYERACVIADYLRRFKGGGRVIVLDANPKIMAEAHTFTNAFNVTYAGMVDYRPNAEVVEVDSVGLTAYTAGGDQATGDVVNVIPPHRAPDLLDRAGLLTVGGRWAGVDVVTYESTVHAGIHVIGDAQGSGQPKAGHIANAEAKVCADAVLRSLQGIAPDPSPVTNSACFSPITADTASWLTAVFQYDPISRSMKPVPESSGEAPRPSRENYRDMFAWSENLFADTFG